MSVEKFAALNEDEKKKLYEKAIFSPYVATIGVVIKDGKVTRFIWDMQKVPGTSEERAINGVLECDSRRARR